MTQNLTYISSCGQDTAEQRAMAEFELQAAETGAVCAEGLVSVFREAFHNSEWTLLTTTVSELL